MITSECLSDHLDSLLHNTSDLESINTLQNKILRPGEKDKNSHFALVDCKRVKSRALKYRRKNRNRETGNVSKIEFKLKQTV